MEKCKEKNKEAMHNVYQTKTKDKIFHQSIF